MSEPTRHPNSRSREKASPVSDSSRFLWPFELLEKLGEGGMGVVYKAKMAKKEIVVALKLLPEDINDDVVRARFERETEILKSLRHPNIVKAFGGKCDNDRPFYAMELIEGGSIEDRIKRSGVLEWKTVVRYSQQMCDGLGYAHELGIVHRDVKPANFLMTKTGQLKLTDFGLASVVSDRKLTQAGRTMGTINYMAPEQIRGKPAVSAQTDLYALGCVMFEMLAGHTPFEGDNSAAVMQDHLRKAPPKVTDFNDLCPEGLSKIIQDLLVKDPEDRPQSASEVRKRLDQLLEAPSDHLHVRTSGQTKTASSSKNLSRYEEQTESQQPGWLLPAFIASGVVNVLLAAVLFLWPASTPGYEQMMAALKEHNNENVRAAMAVELAEAVRQDSSVVEDLLECYEEETSRIVKIEILNSIGAAGADGKRYWPLLQKIMKQDPDEQTRSAAMQASNKLKNGS